jgi:MFS transporter, DHA2 family, multidrug resistance protein
MIAERNSRPSAGLAVVCFGVVMIVADNTIVNVALPTLVRELGADTTDLQWIVASYVLAFASLLLPFGALGDRFGRRRLFLGGIAAFTLASAGASTANGVGSLIAFRVGMGAAAAAIYPSTLALVSQLFPDPKQRKGAIAAWAAASGVAVVLGPIIGGLLVEDFWWGSMFLINVPLGVAVFIVGRFLLPESPTAIVGFDHRGSALSIVGVGAGVWALIEAPEMGWMSARIGTAFAFSIATLAVFVLVERRTAHPLLPLEFFRHAEFRGSVVAIGVATGSLFGFVFVATQFLQLVLGYSPLQAGLHYLPFALAMIVAAVTAPLLAKVLGERNVIILGLGLVGTALLLSSQISVDSRFVGLLLVIIVLLGAGMGFTVSIATEAMVSPLPAEHLGVGSAVNDTSRELGGALGVAVFGSIFSAAYRGDALLGAASRLPSEAETLVRATPTSAMSVADSLGASGVGLRRVVAESITTGVQRSGVIAAFGCLVGIAAMFALWRRRAPVQEKRIVAGSVPAPRQTAESRL